MSYDFTEHLHLDGTVYSLQSFPFNDYLAALPSRPHLRGWPGCSNGYRATWAVTECERGRLLCLTALSAPEDSPLAQLFGVHQAPVEATWFSGMLRATRGEERRTGYPTRTFTDDEVHLEVVSGRVLREWVLDLRALPEQTDDELRLSLPRFLWGPRLLGDTGAE